MDKKELDAEWERQHPILWPIIITCVILSAWSLIADVVMLANGIPIDREKYFQAVVIVGAIAIGRFLRRRLIKMKQNKNLDHIPEVQ